MPIEIVPKVKKDAPEVKRGEKPKAVNKIPQKQEKEKDLKLTKQQKSDLRTIKEGGLGDLAQRAEMDHEVQMARADLYKIAKYAIKLHDMLKSVSEAEGIDGWKQSKITKAADYMGSVYHSMDYDMKFAESKQAKNVLKRSKSPTEVSYLESLGAKVAKKLGEEKPKGLYHNVNKRKKAGTSRDADHPDAPSEQDWKNAAKTAKKNESDKQVSEKESPAGGPACWDGKKIGNPKTKMKGGKRVNNCVDDGK